MERPSSKSEPRLKKEERRGPFEVVSFRRSTRTIRGALHAIGAAQDKVAESKQRSKPPTRASPSLEELVLAARDPKTVSLAAGDAVADYNTPAVLRRYTDTAQERQRLAAERKAEAGATAKVTLSRQQSSVSLPRTVAVGAVTIGGRQPSMSGEDSEVGSAHGRSFLGSRGGRRRAGVEARRGAESESAELEADLGDWTSTHAHLPSLEHGGRLAGASQLPPRLHAHGGRRAERLPTSLPIVFSAHTEGLRGSPMDEEYRYVPPSLRYRTIPGAGPSATAHGLATSTAEMRDLLFRAESLAQSGEHASAAAAFLRGMRDGSQALQAHAAKGLARELHELRLYDRPLVGLGGEALGAAAGRGRGQSYSAALTAAGSFSRQPERGCSAAHGATSPAVADRAAGAEGSGEEGSGSGAGSDGGDEGTSFDGFSQNRRGSRRAGHATSGARRAAAARKRGAAAAAAAAERAAPRATGTGGVLGGDGGRRHGAADVTGPLPPRAGKPAFAGEATSVIAFERALSQLDLVDILSTIPAEQAPGLRAVASVLRAWRRPLGRLMSSFGSVSIVVPFTTQEQQYGQASAAVDAVSGEAAGEVERAGAQLAAAVPVSGTSGKAPAANGGAAGNGRHADTPALQGQSAMLQRGRTWSNAARSHAAPLALSLDGLTRLVRALGLGQEEVADEILNVVFVRAGWARCEPELRRGDTSGGLLLHEVLGALCRLANFCYREHAALPLERRVGRFLRRYVGRYFSSAHGEGGKGVGGGAKEEVDDIVVVGGAAVGVRDCLDGRECEDLYYAYRPVLYPLFERYAVRRQLEKGAKRRGRTTLADALLGPSLDEPEQQESASSFRSERGGAAQQPAPLAAAARGAAVAAPGEGAALPPVPRQEAADPRKPPRAAREAEDKARAAESGEEEGGSEAGSDWGGLAEPNASAAEMTIDAADWLSLWRSAGLVSEAQEKMATGATSLNPHAWAKLRAELKRSGAKVPVGLLPLEVHGVYVDAQQCDDAGDGGGAARVLVDAEMTYDEFWEGIARFAAKLPDYAFDLIKDVLGRLSSMPTSGGLSVPLAARTHMLLQLLLRTWRKEERARALSRRAEAKDGAHRLSLAGGLAQHLEAAPVRAAVLLGQYREQRV